MRELDGRRQAGSGGRLVFAVSMACIGAAVSAYLALYQLGVTRGAWDPLFGRGSELVLRSTFSRSLPVPDALVGACAYVVEVVLGGLALRSGSSAARVAFGLLGLAMGATGVFLVGLQAFAIHAFCSLCLVSAGISIALGWVAAAELRQGAAGLAVLRWTRAGDRTN